MTEKRFAVVRLGSLGDIVHTFPAVAALRESFPGAQIVWLTHPRWVSLVASSDLATEIWPLDSRDLSSVRQIIAKLRDFHPDAVIDYQGLWKSALPRIPRRRASSHRLFLAHHPRIRRSHPVYRPREVPRRTYR